MAEKGRKMSKLQNGHADPSQQSNNHNNSKYSILDRPEVEQIQYQFRREDYQKQGFIQFNQLMSVMGCFFKIDANKKEKIFKEIENKSIKVLDLEAVLIVAAMLKEIELSNTRHEDSDIGSEYSDVFIALGGNADLSGHVLRQTIVEIITNEFELSIDMSQFLDKLETQDEQLDFQNFCQVFEAEEKAALSRAGSVISLLSTRSRRSVINVGGLKSQESFKTLKVKYRDFEKFQAEQEAKEQEKYQQHAQQHEEDEEHSPTSPHSPDKLY